MNGTRGAMFKRWGAWLLWALCAFAVVGCVAPTRYALGTSTVDVLKSEGAPTAKYPLPGGGERWQYSLQPGGAEVYNLDFNPQGQLVKSEQVLTQNNLYRIEQGWTRDRVQEMLGMPARIEHVVSFTGDIWTYNFLDMNEPRRVHVFIDPQGIVQRVMYTDVMRDHERYNMIW